MEPLPACKLPSRPPDLSRRELLIALLDPAARHTGPADFIKRRPQIAQVYKMSDGQQTPHPQATGAGWTSFIKVLRLLALLPHRLSSRMLLTRPRASAVHRFLQWRPLFPDRPTLYSLVHESHRVQLILGRTSCRICSPCAGTRCRQESFVGAEVVSDDP